MQPGSQNANLAANSSGSDLYMATFGNMGFIIQPSMTGEVSNTFGVVPYLSLENVIQAQAVNAQTSPTNVMSGQSSGQQNIQGQTTIQDANGLTRMVMGFQQGGF